MKLQAEWGTTGDLPPERRKRIERHLEKAGLAECSTAQLFKQFEATPEEGIVEPYRKPLRALSGSELNFRDDLTYSLEREQRLARATVARQQRLEEQDRRHREWTAKQVQLDRISSATSDLLRNAYQFAPEIWYQSDDLEPLTAAATRLQSELKQLLEHIETEEEARWLADIARQTAVEERLQTLQGVIRQIQDSLSKASQAEERDRLILHRTATRLQQAIFDRYERQRLLAERQRLLAEREARRQAERHWHPIEAKDELIRGQQVIQTPILIGDRIRRAPGWPDEIYQGVSGAGYSTDRHTYTSLVGWQIWKTNPRNS